MVKDSKSPQKTDESTDSPASSSVSLAVGVQLIEPSDPGRSRGKPTRTSTAHFFFVLLRVTSCYFVSFVVDCSLRRLFGVHSTRPMKTIRRLTSRLLIAHRNSHGGSNPVHWQGATMFQTGRADRTREPIDARELARCLDRTRSLRDNEPTNSTSKPIVREPHDRGRYARKSMTRIPFPARLSPQGRGD